MASSAQRSSGGRGATGTNVPGAQDEASNMDDLRRLQLAHEGMRLLLSSEVKQAEQLFRRARFTGPELNAGHSFVQLVRSLMTFEEDAMDAAYKSLEGTEKFCDTSKKFSELFTSTSNMQKKFTPHQKLYRKSIIADCLLFEAILVFIRQSLTSYVKGGYLIRKAWKMYEKIYNETERICSQPSPISKPDVSSPTDKHVGSSLYDDKGSYQEENLPEEEEGENEEDMKQTMAALTDTFAMQLGFGGMSADREEGEGGEGVFQNGSPPNSLSKSPNDATDLQEATVSDSTAASNGVTPQLFPGNSRHTASTTSNTRADSQSLASERRAADVLHLSSECEGVGGGWEGGGTADDLTDGRSGERVKKKKKKRPPSGYDLPEVTTCNLVSDLGHEDDRLRGAVYFGYGVMNIVLSLIPPKLMKLANLFGFSGNRRLGLQALEFASHSRDMKAPLARITLLWYHTIVRPFFALDAEGEAAGADEADRLLKEAESLYPNSALFLYFKGKVLYMRCQLDDALAVYTSAASLSKDQREIEHIALYEKGWIHFLQLNYAESLPCYLRLKNETRWSACFYAYLCAIMTGVMGDLKESRELFLQSSRLVKRKNNNLEKFCFRRAQLYKKGVTFHMPLEARLMILEVCYLWRALPFCSEEIKLQMMEMLDLALPPDTQPFHRAMRAWLRGGVLNSLRRPREAEKSLREALEYEADIKHDKHIITFSLYELATIHIGNTEYAKARILLNFAKDAYSGYEFEARLNFKVHSTLNSLR